MDDSLPDCPVCLDGFKDPRLLQCGHCICFGCVTQLPIHRGQLSCPTCKKEFPCPSFDSLPKNYSLMEAFELMKNIQKSQEARAKKCTQHAGQDLDLICITCGDLPVCAKCLLVGTHKGHEHVAVEEYDATRKKKATLLAAKVELSSLVKPLSEMYDRIPNNIEQMISKLKEYAINTEAQHQLVKVIESELESTSDTNIENFEKTLKEMELRVHDLAGQHNSLVNTLEAQFRTLICEKSPLSKPQPSPSPSLSLSPAPVLVPVPSPIPNPSPLPASSSSPAHVSAPSSSSSSPSPSSPAARSPPPTTSSSSPQPTSNRNAPTTTTSTSSASSPAPAPPAAATIGEQLFIVGGMNIQTFDTVLVHRPGDNPLAAGSWSEIAPLSAKRNNVSAVFEGSSLYVVGGVDDSGILNSMLKYDVTERMWRVMPNMSYKRNSLSTVVFNNHIWAIGGSDGENSLDSVEIYNLAQRRWTRASNLPYARNFHASAVTQENGGFIFTLGGSMGMERTKTAATCDRDGRWTQIAPMSIQRSGLASVAIGKSIYALGGFDGKQRLNSMEVYRMDEGRWSPLPPMASPRVWFGAVTMANGNIYALGGYDGKSRLKSVEIFDPRAGRWELLQDMSLPYPVSGFGYAKS